MRDVSASRSRLDEVQAKLIDEFKGLDAPAGTRPGTGNGVRDADSARQMVDSMRNSMMASATAQAQANAMPQSVLQLLV
jgi:flagellin-like hook-associated protein FlgL